MINGIWRSCDERTAFLQFLLNVSYGCISFLGTLPQAVPDNALQFFRHILDELVERSRLLTRPTL
jgi:hypothetical protein